MVQSNYSISLLANVYCRNSDLAKLLKEKIEGKMPIYEYRCQSCGHQFDKLQKINDALLVECPVCGKSSLKKLVSAAGFRLTGSGWYETDFKNNNKKSNETVAEKEDLSKKSSVDNTSGEKTKKDALNEGKSEITNSKATT
jgi:putative FmdB family regulatory protein